MSTHVSNNHNYVLIFCTLVNEIINKLNKNTEILTMVVPNDLVIKIQPWKSPVNIIFGVNFEVSILH